MRAEKASAFLPIARIHRATAILSVNTFSLLPLLQVQASLDLPYWSAQVVRHYGALLVLAGAGILSVVLCTQLRQHATSGMRQQPLCAAGASVIHNLCLFCPCGCNSLTLCALRCLIDCTGPVQLALSYPASSSSCVGHALPRVPCLGRIGCALKGVDQIIRFTPVAGGLWYIALQGESLRPFPLLSARSCIKRVMPVLFKICKYGQVRLLRCTTSRRTRSLRRNTLVLNFPSFLSLSDTKRRVEDAVGRGAVPMGAPTAHGLCLASGCRRRCCRLGDPGKTHTCRFLGRPSPARETDGSVLSEV